LLLIICSPILGVTPVGPVKLEIAILLEDGAVVVDHTEKPSAPSSPTILLH